MATTWTCSVCGKTFAKANQSHICGKFDLEAIFDRKGAHLLPLYRLLISRLTPMGPFLETTSRKTITLYSPAGKSFLCIQPKQKWLDLWFNLDREINEFPVFKIVQPSRQKFAHFIRIDEPEDIEQIWLDWVEEAYQLALL